MTVKTKTHFLWNGYHICSDHRDICLPGELDYAVYKWCNESAVNGSIFMKLEDHSVWRIKDEQDRAWFILKWGKGEGV